MGWLQKLGVFIFYNTFRRASFLRPCLSNQYSKVPGNYTFRFHLHAKCHCARELQRQKSFLSESGSLLFYLINSLKLFLE